MIFHGVDHLSRVVELNGLGTLVDAGSGFIVLVLMLCGVLLGVLFKYFTLFRRVPGTMQEACLFQTVWRITRLSYIVSIANSSVALLGVGW